MWSVAYAVDDDNVPIGKSRFDRCRKKYPEAWVSLHTRLGMLLASLNGGRSLKDTLNRGWIHPEQGAVFAIDPGRPALRLYCCLDHANSRIVILTLGEKKRQRADVLDALAWAKEILGQER